jgi:hypothetical protein
LKIVDHVLAQCTPDKLYYDEDKFTLEHVQGIVHEELYRRHLFVIQVTDRVCIPYMLYNEIDYRFQLRTPQQKELHSLYYDIVLKTEHHTR